MTTLKALTNTWTGVKQKKFHTKKSWALSPNIVIYWKRKHFKSIFKNPPTGLGITAEGPRSSSHPRRISFVLQSKASILPACRLLLIPCCFCGLLTQCFPLSLTLQPYKGHYSIFDFHIWRQTYKLLSCWKSHGFYSEVNKFGVPDTGPH